MSPSDYATDAVIQESLRQELDKGVTLLTVAHRLQTIMDSDKIVSSARAYLIRWPYHGMFADGARCWPNRAYQIPIIVSTLTDVVVGRVW